LEGTGGLFRRWQSTLRRISSFRVSQGDFRMLVGALVTFLVVILILYLINLLPLDGRAKQIVRVVVIILGVISLLKYIAVF
jgi:Na+/melibiose symporter-like transporter